MTLNQNSYGSVEGVATLARSFTNNGEFDNTTNPTYEQVEGWIDELSGEMNVCLAGAGFVIPVTQDDAKTAIRSIIQEGAAELCRAANSAGRFFTDRALEAGTDPKRAIRREIAGWVNEHATGLERILAARKTSNASQVGFQETDPNGNEVKPFFSRSQFGNRD